jgi:hypothetical protein
VLQFFKEQHLPILGRDRFGAREWQAPTISASTSVLKNPAYAGAFVYGKSRTVRQASAPGKAAQKQLPLEAWQIRVNDTYPAYIPWETYAKIRAMRKDNSAEYDRNKTRGVPRAGAALLHGLLSCGECGHTMMVQYQGGTLYLCNALRQKYGVPVGQNSPADWIDAAVVDAFFQALSPIALDVYARAVAAQRPTDEQTERARQQQLERRRYQAALAQRQYSRCDPDNRLGAAAREARWEAALHELQEAEATAAQAQTPTAVPCVLTAERQATCSHIGQRLPQLWGTPVLSQPQRNALLRCLIDKVAWHRVARSQVQVRIVWRGGETTTLRVPVKVKSLAVLPRAAEMEQLIHALFAAGYSDAASAQRLTAQGHRSPSSQAVLPHTVRLIRLTQRLFQQRSQSHPRHIAGALTVPQIARGLEVPVHWISDHIHRGTIVITKDPATRLSVCPDRPQTRRLFKDLQAGTRRRIRCAEDSPSGAALPKAIVIP